MILFQVFTLYSTSLKFGFPQWLINTYSDPSVKMKKAPSTSFTIIGHVTKDYKRARCRDARKSSSRADSSRVPDHASWPRDSHFENMGYLKYRKEIKKRQTTKNEN